MTATATVKSDLKTKEGAAVVAQEVLNHLGSNWMVHKIRGEGSSWAILVVLKEDRGFHGIEVTHEIGRADRYTAWIQSTEYSDHRSADTPVQAVKALREALKDRIDELQALAAKINA